MVAKHVIAQRKQVVSELTGSGVRTWWVGSPHAPWQNGERAAYDVLTIQSNRPNFVGRMINALAAAL